MIYPPKPSTSSFDVETDLLNFFILTFYVPVDLVRPLIPQKFKLITVKDESGREQALLSIVPFQDKSFHFKFLPFFKQNFYQTNYRIYVEDTTTGEHVVWFLGTMLASGWNKIPKSWWKLPWHRGFMSTSRNGSVIESKTQCEWSENFWKVDLTEKPLALPGFKNIEEGLYILTHPLKGYYYRQDGELGSYQIWHDRLEVKSVKLLEGKFKVLNSLGIEDYKIHSVLYVPKTHFTIYLPPKIIT